MAIPLYQNVEIPNSFPQGGHLGLWFTRFFNQYDREWQVKKEKKENPKQEDGKRKWIILTAKEVCGEQEALERYKNRVLNLVKGLKNKAELDANDYAICETNWNFVTGMGLPHPVENGMAWHHTLGVPFLAGSTMKGLLRAWVEGGWNDELNQEQTVKRRQNWFGMVEGEDTEDKAGQLIFFDAVPIEPVKLTADIMTPHYGDWYAEGDKIAGNDEHKRMPADWHEPVPIPFLAVKKANFLVTVVARDKDNDEDARQALQELVKALQWLGAGAKTAAGYGHLIRSEIVQKSVTDREKILDKFTSDLEKEVYQDLFVANQSEGEVNASNWLVKMEATELGDAKKIALQLKAFYESIGKWKKPKKKQKLKVELVKKVLENQT